MVKICQDQYFPADLILVKSSNPNGIAYIETKNLDGETNLKHKSCIAKELQSEISDPSKGASLRGLITCESPNDQLYKFEGTVNIGEENPLANKTHSLDHNNLLLRGTSLKNTDWVYGLVVYSGHDTRIMRNQSKSRTKFSKLELQTNRQIILIFLFQILICMISSGFNTLWTLRIGQTNHPYLELNLTEV
jgi:phospholipid-transporting ATPase